MKISCIVPVYNEGARVKSVLDAIVGHPDIDEVVVVNDGSSDDSEEVLKKISGISLISYKPNRGKSHAVRVGIQAAKNDFIMTIDSDLIGLAKENLSALIAPVKNGQADMAMSLRKNSLWIYKLFGLDFVSGERVFNKNIIENLDELEKLPGFGLESFLNLILVKRKMRLAVVNWPNVITPRKSAKMGYWTGTVADYRMVKQIVSLLTFIGVIKMFVQMIKLRI